MSPQPARTPERTCAHEDPARCPHPGRRRHEPHASVPGGCEDLAPGARRESGLIAPLDAPVWRGNPVARTRPLRPRRDRRDLRPKLGLTSPMASTRLIMTTKVVHDG